MQVGTARIDITPPVGVDLTGFTARENPSVGIHDPLYATALVAEDAGHRVALVSCDLIGLGAATVRRVRSLAERTSGVPAGAQLYACTHTHAGPETGVLVTLGDPDPAYLRRLEAQLAEVVSEAAAGLAPARLGVARGACPDAAYNRVLSRARQDDTRVDPEVFVVRFEGASGRPLATLVSYGCHAVAAGGTNRLISADWPGVVREALEGAGAGPTMVVNGPCGDLDPRAKPFGLPALESTGRAIAEAAWGAWERVQPVEALGVGAMRADVPLALLPLAGAESLAALWERWQEAARTEAPGSVAYRSAALMYRDHVLRLSRLHWGFERVPAYTGEAQALRIGSVGVAALPGEFFSAYGLRIKAASRAPATIVAGLANDALGYFPTPEAFPIGGYEMDTASRCYGMPAPWSPDSGVAVADRDVELLGALFG